jgi:hypothetical protein
VPKPKLTQKPKIPAILWLVAMYTLVTGLLSLFAINFSLDSNTYKDQAAYSLVVSTVNALAAGTAYFGLRQKYRNTGYLLVIAGVFAIAILGSIRAFSVTEGYDYLGHGDVFSGLWQALYISLVFIAGPLYGIGLVGANEQSKVLFRRMAAGIGFVLVAFSVGFVFPVQQAMTDSRANYQAQMDQNAEQTAQEDAADEAANQQQYATEQYLQAGVKPTLANIHKAAQANKGVIPNSVEPPTGYSFVEYAVTADRDAWSEAQVCLKGTDTEVVGIIVQYNKTDSSMMYSPSSHRTTCSYTRNFIDYNPS